VSLVQSDVDLLFWVAEGVGLAPHFFYLSFFYFCLLLFCLYMSPLLTALYTALLTALLGFIF